MAGHAVNEQTTVYCPYCLVGSATIVRRVTYDSFGRPGAFEIDRFRDPRQCNGCGHWFRLHVKSHIVGVGLDYGLEQTK